MVGLDQLAAALPEGALVSDEARMEKYRRDRAADPDAGVPLAVVRATCTADVQAAVRWAAERGIGVIPRGAGTGLSGGATAQPGCLVVSTERMTAIGIDTPTRTAVVEPGALNIDVKRAAAEHGLWYPPDPSSYEICSIGGNVATNAGGLCCVKYGVTSDYVLGLTVVLADGTAVEVGGPRLKDTAGLSLTKLFVGSEGTLGIVTRAVLRLLPAQQAPATLVATFASLDAAIAAVVAITGRMRPSMLELMDRVSINASEDALRMGLDRNAEAMLLMQSDESTPRATEEIATMAACCTAHGASEVVSTDDPDEAAAFIAARRLVITSMEAHGSLLLEDVGVPLPRLGELVRGIGEVADRHEVTVAVVAHAGDGNTHPLIVHDPADAEQTVRAHAAYAEIMRLGIALGGTITGEHGVGRLKRAWLGEQLGPDVLALNHRIKQALDPQGILNPGAAL